jgi:hypothetical protein
MYLNIALAAGGSFAGPAGGATPSVAAMEIDCVRVYEPKTTR